MNYAGFDGNYMEKFEMFFLLTLRKLNELHVYLKTVQTN